MSFPAYPAKSPSRIPLIVGAVVGSLSFIGVVAGAIFFVCRKLRQINLVKMDLSDDMIEPFTPRAPMLTWYGSWRRDRSLRDDGSYASTDRTQVDDRYVSSRQMLERASSLFDNHIVDGKTDP